MSWNPTELQRRREDIVGLRFGRLEVLAFEETPGRRRLYFSCMCDCGTIRVVRKEALVSGQTVSCGCYRDERNRLQCLDNVTHGQCGHPLYKTWAAMIARCENPDHQVYHLYGGRGIKVCERWRNSPEVFFEDMGPRPSGYSLDRFPDNDGDYEPSNCRWATQKEQTRNFRRNHMIEWGGESMCVTDWAARLGVSYTSFLQRLRSGWSIERAITTPFAKRKSRVPKVRSEER